jgi:hypothetical protein
MKIRLPILLILILCIKSSPGLSQTNSVLATGQWFKIAITESGVYKINHSLLSSFGIDVSSVDPAKIRLFGHGAGMLPQLNSAPRPVDLEEIAISVEGEQDGSFDSQDYILFYGEGPDKFEFDSAKQVFNYEQHPYSDTAYYFLNIEQEAGKRIYEQSAVVGSYPIINSYNHGYVHEVDQYNILQSGREWFGELFDLTLSQQFITDVDDIVPGSDLQIQSRVMASSAEVTTFKVSLDGQLVGEQTINPVPQSRYAIKGLISDETFKLSDASLNSSPLNIDYVYEKQSGAGYLDFFVVTALRDLSYKNKPLSFISIESTKNSISTFIISTATNNLTLWDITDANQAVRVPVELNNSVLNFNNNSSVLRKYYLFDKNSALPEPVFVNRVANQNLHGINSIDFIIVTNPAFLSAANRLAEVRLADGIATYVATTSAIYNEFSAGKADITAIRDMAKYLYDNAGLKHLLIFGKGTYDNKNILEKNLSFVPIYESRNSLHPLSTYGSDDYLGFLEDDEGDWIEQNSGDHTMDIGVGRLPVKTITEANNIIDKLVDYKSYEAVGDWRKKVSFVAEDGDFNIHQRDADRLATLIDTTYSSFNPNKIYIDAYPIEVSPGFKRAPEVNEVIINTIETGTLIINYTGHGNEIQWAKTRVFDKNTIESLENMHRYPLFVTATCEFGRHDDPQLISGAEDLIVKEDAGAIAMITTARPVFSSSNYSLNLAFYNQVFAIKDGLHPQLGDVFKSTKNNSLNGVLNRNFSLLGDPSMTLAYPQLTIRVDSLNGNILGISDTIQALQTVSFRGSIRDGNNFVQADFDGLLNATFFDRATAKQTLGNSGPAFNYTDRDNVLFRGKVSVRQGLFEIKFVVPKDILYNPEYGKLSLYSVKSSSNLDASGAEISVQIGNTTSSPDTDVTPPRIDIYLGDTTFVNRSTISSNTLLLVKLFDENGINISNSQIGHSITFKLDNGDPVVLNDYFSADPDTYKTGWVQFPLNDLTVGEHIISLKAWDSYNNPAENYITFFVSEENELRITELRNYPNPMDYYTTFYVRHSSPGEDLEVTIEVINTNGQKVFRETRSYFSAPGVINDWYWDGRNHSGGKLNEAIYVYSVLIRSKNSGNTGRRYSRLFITN